MSIFLSEINQSFAINFCFNEWMAFEEAPSIELTSAIDNVTKKLILHFENMSERDVLREGGLKFETVIRWNEDRERKSKQRREIKKRVEAFKSYLATDIILYSISMMSVGCLKSASFGTTAVWNTQVPGDNVIKVLLACIYKSVNTGTFLKSLAATSIFKRIMLILVFTS